MPAPWQEDQFKVVVEFLKSSAGAKRTIQLKHAAALVPSQLQGRISPQVWQAFMADIEQVGADTQRCSAACCCCGGSIGPCLTACRPARLPSSIHTWSSHQQDVWAAGWRVGRWVLSLAAVLSTPMEETMACGCHRCV